MNFQHPSPAVIATFDSRFERLVAEQTDATSVALACELIDALKQRNTPLPFVYPLEEGGFSFEWRHNAKRNHLLLEVSAGEVALYDVALEDESDRECFGLSIEGALEEVGAIADLIGHTGHGVSDEEIQHMLECIAVAIEMTSGSAIERAERAGLAFIAAWDQEARVRFAGDLAVVAMQAMESCTAHIFEVFLDSCRPALQTGAVDEGRVSQLLEQ